MFNDTDLAASVLKNPGKLQGLILGEIEDRLGGVTTIADPNNGFNVQLEASVSLTAQTVRFMASRFNAMYPVLATTSAELHNHMSDFDYQNMVAKPASTKVRLTFDKNYLIDNAEIVNSDYKQVIIPADTVFTIGSRSFGIYYPIIIKINRSTDNFVVVYDGNTHNPLHALSSNMVDFVIYPYSNLELITLTFPVYQFTKSTDISNVIAQQGFSKGFNLSDQFYACRIFTNDSNGNWKELKQTLSEDVYDAMEPTAKLKLASDSDSLVISIPQIYFTNGVIGNQIQVDIYTTQGELDVNISKVDAAACNLRFAENGEISKYSAILINLPSINLIPAETNIIGGSNALTFEQLRSRIISGSLYDQVPVTPPQLRAYVGDAGFALTKYLDNVTNRIYYGSRTILGANDVAVPVTTASIVVDDIVTPDVSTILSFTNDGAVTILPTTLYRYVETNNSCIPLTDTQLSILTNKNKRDLAAELNSRVYCKTPFHIVTYQNTRYPISKTFDLLNPSIDGIQFISENYGLSAQMSVNAAIIIHRDDGTGGFVLRLGVIKTTDMENVVEDNLKIIVTMVDKSGRTGYLIATKSGASGVMTYYDCVITTTYNITQDGYFESALNYGDGTRTTTCYLSLNMKFDVLFLVERAEFPTVSNDSNILSLVPQQFRTMLAVSHQQLMGTFGKDLSGGIFNVTNAVWSQQQFVTYPENVYHTYAHDVYETNPDGSLVYTIVNNEVVLNLIHQAGDQVLDPSGQPVIKHAVGDIKYHTDGEPIIAKDRNLLYYVSAMMFDAKLFYSDTSADKQYIASLAKTISDYVDTITNISDSLLEQTQLYFKPNRTMGTSVFGIGNGATTTIPLGLEFSVRFYVLKSTKENASLRSIIDSNARSIIHEFINRPVISLLDMGAEMRRVLKDQILGIDILGINGDSELQTLIITEEDAKPMVASYLEYDRYNDRLSLTQAISIDYAIKQDTVL